MTASRETKGGRSGWWLRLRYFAAALLMWAALHVLLGPLLPSGHERPIVLGASGLGALAMPLAVLILWVGVAVTARWLTPGDPRHPLMAMGLALALWAAEGGRTGGVIDNWLLRELVKVDGPRGWPYAWLLLEYLWLVPAVVGAWVLANWWREPGAGAAVERVRRALVPPGAGADLRLGLLALLVTTLAGGAAIVLLGGPASGSTLRGQVYFAVGFGMFVGMFLARRLVGVSDPRWYLAAPVLLGVVGLVVAALRPAVGIPAELAHLDTIPAWTLARALPVEMVGVGLVGVLCMLAPAEGKRAAA